MGVIEIRNRSERLGNVGSVRMADVRTGAAEAYAQEAQAIGADAERKRNLASGLGDLGRGLMALGLTLRDKEDQAKVDAYVSRYQSEMNAFNNGYVGENGERVKGAMEAMPATEDETVEWERGCYSHRNHVGSSLRKELKLNDRQMQMADKRLVGYNLTLQSNWATRSGTLNRQRELAGAQTRERESCRALEMLPSEAVNSDAAITTWMEWRDAGERMLQVQGIDPGSEQADEYRRARALSVLKTRFEKRLRNEEAACEGLSPDEAKERMGQFRSALKDSDPIQLLVPDSTAVRGDDGQTIADFVRAALGSDADARMEDFRSAAVRDAKASENRAEGEARARVAEGQRKAREDAVAAERDFISKNPIPETPEGQEAHFGRMAEMYDRLSEDESLDAGTRLSYAKAASRMRGDVLSSKAAAKREAKAEAREAERERKAALREAKAELKEMQQGVFDVASHDFEAGAYTDDDGVRHYMTSKEMAERARRLLNSKAIDRTQFSKLMSIQARKLTGEHAAFRDAVLDEAKNLLPNLAYRDDRFQFRPSAKTGVGSRAAKFSRGFLSSEEWTYGQFIQAMNQTLDWADAQKGPVSTEEMKAHFDGLTKEPREQAKRLTVKERLQRDADATESLMQMNRRFGNGGN